MRKATIGIVIVVVSALGLHQFFNAEIFADNPPAKSTGQIILMGLNISSAAEGAADDQSTGLTEDVTARETSAKEGDIEKRPNRFSFRALNPHDNVLRTITEFPGHAWIGRISPDGQQIVFNMPAHSVSFADDGDG